MVAYGDGARSERGGEGLRGEGLSVEDEGLVRVVELSVSPSTTHPLCPPQPSGQEGLRRLRHVLSAGVFGVLALAAVLLFAGSQASSTTGPKELLMSDGDLEKLFQIPKKIPGVKKKVQQIIDSGKWDEEAIKLDLKYGLLPSSWKKPTEPEDDITRKKDSVRTVAPAAGVGHPFGDRPSGKASSGAPMVVAPGNPSPSAPQPPNATGSAAVGGAAGGAYAGRNNSYEGYVEPADFTVQGHCMMKPDKRCTEDANCQTEGGGCVFWHCTSDPEMRCNNDMDCSSLGGICTGPGHCSNKPSIACFKDSNCLAYGGSCILTGFCANVPSRSCSKDSDCGDSGGGCRTKQSVWYQVDENFPRNPNFGPFGNWTTAQLHEKLLVLVLKILHLQHDLESQVPINTEFLKDLKHMKKTGAMDADTAKKNVSNTTAALEAEYGDLSGVIEGDSAKLGSDVASLQGFLHASNVNDESRLHSVDEDPFWNKAKDMIASLVLRTRLLVRAQNDTIAEWKESQDPIDFENEMNFTVNREVNALALKLADAIEEYSTSSRTHYREGYRKLVQTVKQFMYFTNMHVKQADRHRKLIQRRIWRGALRRFREMGLLENATFDDSELWTADSDHMENQSMSMRHGPISTFESEVQRHMDNMNPNAGFVAKFFNVERSMHSMPEWSELHANFSAMISHPKVINYRHHADFLVDAPDLIGLHDHHIAAEFTGVIHIDKGGVYYFNTRSDDGSHLWIDNHMVVDNSGLHPPVTVEGFMHLQPGYHDFRADFFENQGGEYMVIKYRGPDTKDRNVLLKGLRSVPGAGDLHPGFIARFYSLEHRDHIDHMPGLSDLEPEATTYPKFIDLPTHDDFLREDPQIPVDRVAAEWTGVIHIELAGEYTFQSSSDDGSHVWVNGIMIVNNGGLHGVETRTGTLYLGPGYHDFRADFFENYGGEAMTVKYQGPDTKGDVVLLTGYHRAI